MAISFQDRLHVEVLRAPSGLDCDALGAITFVDQDGVGQNAVHQVDGRVFQVDDFDRAVDNALERARQIRMEALQRMLRGLPPNDGNVDVAVWPLFSARGTTEEVDGCELGSAGLEEAAQALHDGVPPSVRARTSRGSVRGSHGASIPHPRDRHFNVHTAGLWSKNTVSVTGGCPSLTPAVQQLPVKASLMTWSMLKNPP